MEPIQAEAFERIVLLLTTALGLAFLIERVLGVVNRLMKRLLRSASATPAVPVPVSEALVDGLETRALWATLEEQAEAAEAVEARRTGADRATRDRLARDADAARSAALQTAEKLADLLRRRLATPALARPERVRLRQRLGALDEQIRTRTPLADRLEVEERAAEAAVFLNPISPKDAERTVRVLWLQLIGVFAGVAACTASGFGLFEPLGLFGTALRPADYVLTGVLIGAGSEPIHFLIKFVTDRKVAEVAAAEPATQEAQAPTARASVAAPERRPLPVPTSNPIGVPYAGGVDPDALEHRHRRRADPDLIVYHHTAMHSRSTFADVVRVIEGRGWSTGYNCVVTDDGAIYPFCRWDRYGNHARGYNARSLGIALNGNFETAPGDRYANLNGKYGNARPTDPQLLSAARVVALWCHLYGMAPAFGETVVPHKQIAAKACPGSNFPHAAFEELVRQFHARWAASTAAQEELALFKQKAYLYA